MKLTQKQIVMLGAAGMLIIIVGILVVLNTRHANNTQQVKLNVWGTENAAKFENLSNTYPYGQVTYTQIDPNNYRSQLLSALAAGSGPDVFEIGNRELPIWKSVIAPMPAALAATFGPA